MKSNQPTVLLFAPPKRGKTDAAMRALSPEYCRYACLERGALNPQHNPERNHWRLRDGKVVPVGGEGKPVLFEKAQELLSIADPIGELEKFVELAVKEVPETRTLCLDTLSNWAQRSYAIVAKSTPDGYGKREKELKAHLTRILGKAMQANLIIVALAHEQPSSTIDGKFKPTGPKMPGDMVQDVPGMFDMVLQIGVSYVGTENARVVKCNPLDTQTVTGERYGVVTDGELLDLRAILGRAIVRGS